MPDDFPAPFGSSERRGGKCRSKLLALAVLAALAPLPALAQKAERDEGIGKGAVNAVTQPLTDLNIRTRQIPAVLEKAAMAPYDLPPDRTCANLHGDIGHLDEVLGPDVDDPTDQEGLVSKGLKFGGDILSGFIPFRGVVRELSGANAERARWDTAIHAGSARRSFLKGYAKGIGCASRQETAIQAAEQVLGLDKTSE
ncbi:hypothetical protein [Tsuneonella sp. SYSU-LHT278]|uniref:hypothetical protein n=1 Tax=Tsuneonella sediminis TaxID=3416089 RepID=UPI003F7AD8B3